MDQSHKELLNRNSPYLVRNLTVSELLFSRLKSEDIITDNMYETIMAEKTIQEKTSRLLNILPRRGPKAFKCFIRALIESKHGFVAERLHPTLYAEVMQEMNNERLAEDPQEPEHLRGQQQQQQSLESGSSTNNSSIDNGTSSGRTNIPVQPTRNDERVVVETSVGHGHVGIAMQESGDDRGNTAAGYSGSVAACGTSLRGSTGRGNGDILENIDPAGGGDGNTGVGVPVSDDQGDDNTGVGIPVSDDQGDGNTGVGIPVSDDNLLPGTSSSGTAATTSGVTQSMRESLPRVEPVLTDESQAQVITDEERNVVSNLTMELDNWTRNFAGTQSLAVEIEELKPSRQVKNGLCLLMTDDELRDNAAIDNMELLVQTLGFQCFQDLSVSLDSRANNKNSEVIKMEISKELVRLGHTISNNYDGLLVIVMCRGVGDLKDKATRVAVVNDCLSILKSDSTLSCLVNKPQLFFFNFSVEQDTTSGSGIGEVDAQEAFMLDDNANAMENSAVLELESYPWTCNQPNLFPWVFVKSFVKTSPGASIQSILNIIKAFFRTRRVEMRAVNLKTCLRPDFTLTAK